MRLGNHAEAEQAASYIGRQHKFVLSQLTATSGGNQSLTRSDTQGYGDSDTSSRSWQEFHLGPGSRSRGTSTSQNWSTAHSWADGTNWSDAAATQRVYEYAVEPTVLQNLPTTPCCSPYAARPARDCTRWSAILRSLPCPASEAVP